MAARGRKSAAALSVVSPTVARRPAAPNHLTAAERREWRAIVEQMPADWFPRETHELLARYCRHVMRAREIDAKLTDVIGRDDVAGNLTLLDKLTAIAARESRLIGDLATKLRLTNQARYTPKAAATASKKSATGKPWQKSAS